MPVIIGEMGDYDGWKLACPYDDDLLFRDDEPDDEDEHTDEFVLICDTPGCLMPGEHFLCECHTVEDIERADNEHGEAEWPNVADTTTPQVSP